MSETKVMFTDKMLKAVSLYEEAASEVRIGPYSLDAQGVRTARALRVARLVSEAVQRAENICAEPDCDERRQMGQIRCAPHAKEWWEQRERFLADRRAGKPCTSCAFIGSECHACGEYRKECADSPIPTREEPRP